ncbi:hypothetical protein SASPL_150128 [Salvia splendens]|uniref:Uncharacterized protein n=1 Tax=Salvia splendens TaxID=180675 RepID=A0A8X8W6W4_SALSN|nr:hypothetical protein SASPL_150128 [Salvia splendens]
MVERRHGGRCGDARGGGRDLRQQVRDLQRDIENGDLRQQVRDLQRRLARLEKRWGKSNPMRSIASERRSIDDPILNDVFTSSDADEPSKNDNNNILSMPVYDTPAYDEDIFYELPRSMPVYDKPVYDEDILSMPTYDKPVYDEDIFYELPGLMSKSPPPPVKFDDAAEEEGVAVDDDEAEGANRLLGFMFGIFDGAGDHQLVHDYAWESDQVKFSRDCEFPDGGLVKIPSNLVVLFLPIGQSVDSLVDYVEMREFNDAFSTVREAFSVWDIHLCWVAVEIEIDKKKIGCGDNLVAIRDVIRKIGWGFCSSNYIILSSVLFPLGQIYPQVGMSFDFADFGGIRRRKYSGELNLEILDGKRFESRWSQEPELFYGPTHRGASDTPASKYTTRPSFGPRGFLHADSDVPSRIPPSSYTGQQREQPQTWNRHLHPTFPSPRTPAHPQLVLD